MPTTPNGVPITTHAALRMEERHITGNQVDLAIQQGAPRPGNRPGTTEYHYRYLGGPQGNRPMCCKVVTGADGSVVTVMRHRGHA
ncbi:MAG: DUF4258 domain-containing protein [Acidobacteriaceae bacterium]|nr:DUF4258 domain-containing protein [Acidobacteriaceae bacterium]MBV9765651.1 DUF4258 domain-containing protein [Acidobacteriaceae bacterium]